MASSQTKKIFATTVLVLHCSLMVAYCILRLTANMDDPVDTRTVLVKQIPHMTLICGFIPVQLLLSRWAQTPTNPFWKPNVIMVFLLIFAGLAALDYYRYQPSPEKTGLLGLIDGIVLTALWWMAYLLRRREFNAAKRPG